MFNSYWFDQKPLMKRASSNSIWELIIFTWYDKSQLKYFQNVVKCAKFTSIENLLKQPFGIHLNAFEQSE